MPACQIIGNNTQSRTFYGWMDLGGHLSFGIIVIVIISVIIIVIIIVIAIHHH